jgi:LacI family transcriptional regulator
MVRRQVPLSPRSCSLALEFHLLRRLRSSVRDDTRSTIRDVARLAGVGTTTVSRVINGGQLVAPDVRLRVEDVIRQLRYQPNLAARSLKNERTRTVGLIVPRITDPFYATIASVAQDICRAREHILILSTSLDMEEQELQELRIFEQHRVDGLLIVPPKKQSVAFQEYCHQLRTPAVAIDLPFEQDGLASVLTDNREAMANATRHLIEHGRKRILCLVSDPVLYTMRERVRGYIEAITAAALPLLVEGEIHTAAQAEQVLLFALSAPDPIDAVLCANSTLVIFVYEALQKHGIRLPTQLALIGFDDFHLAGTLRPAIANIAQPAEEIGRAATNLLFSMMNDRQQSPVHLHLPSRLIPRESCGCLTADPISSGRVV